MSIKSFVSRLGRLTTGQRRAINTLKKYQIEFREAPLDFAEIFGNENPVVLEIGFGNGETFVGQAEQNPGINWLGIEVYPAGVGSCLMQVEKSGVENIRVIRRDAIEVLKQQIPDASLHKVQLFFPDPWPKKRHHKRRIVQTEFASTVAKKLTDNGLFHLATDWVPYAEHMHEVLDPHPDFKAIDSSKENIKNKCERLQTKFERRGLKLGHVIEDLWFQKG